MSVFGATIGSTINSWFDLKPVEVLVMRACDPSLHEPNYASHLEVAEHIKVKKANTPREAAMLIARLVNNRNPHVSILSLALLNTLVQSCGYAFQLQISTKEFLNELVRRFPERPPPFPGPVMSRILELIHEWKETICVESRYRDDFQNIRDMHRLLTFKGYRFRELPRTPAAFTATATNNLKSADELEEEDRAAQSAKLQELIRRGTPRDLAAAQDLMKSLAGANPDTKPDYRSQSLTELNKLEQKVILLNEMLDNVDASRGEKFATGDVYDQVASILTAARPKIQKWIEDAQQDDPESLDTYLQVNDQINNVIGRYESFKQGDYTASSIPAEVTATSKGDSLIEFDDPASHGGGGSTVDDLADLFGSTTVQSTAAFGLPISSPTTAAPSLSGSGTWSQPSTPMASPPLVNPNTRPMSQQMGAGFGGSMMAPNRVGSPMGMGLSMGMGSAGTVQTPPRSSSVMSGSMQQPPQQQQQTQQKDPFADLAGLF